MSGNSPKSNTYQEELKKEILDTMPHFVDLAYIVAHSISHRSLLCLMYQPINWHFGISLGSFFSHKVCREVKIKEQHFGHSLTCNFEYTTIHSILHQISWYLYELDLNVYL